VQIDLVPTLCLSNCFWQIYGINTSEMITKLASYKNLPKAITDYAFERFDKIRNVSGKLPTSKIRKNIQNIMQ